MNQVFARLRARSARLERHSSAEAAWAANATMQVLIACRPVIQSDSGISGPPERPHSGGRRTNGCAGTLQVSRPLLPEIHSGQWASSEHPLYRGLEQAAANHQPPSAGGSTRIWHLPCPSLPQPPTILVVPSSAILPSKDPFVLWVCSPLLLPLDFLLLSSFSLQYHSDWSGPHSLLGRESQTRPF